MSNLTAFPVDNNDYSFIIKNVTSLVETSLSSPGTSFVPKNVDPVEIRDPLYIVVPITCLYALIFFTGVIGNVSTCIVIARNKSMHTATNYYLFSLAISDLLLLLSGLPPEMYRLWWPQVYIFGNTFCMVQSFSAETSANATVLTITAFTVERYIAICHPFLTHTMSKLSRAVKFVVAIWIAALCLAVPQAIQYGMYYAEDEHGSPVSRCTLTGLLVDHAFEISTLVFFVGPMTVITVLYMLIAFKLRGNRLLRATGSVDEQHGIQRRRSAASQNRVIKMLVAVVVAFFVCWAPFHAQRLLAVYIGNAYKTKQPPGPILLSTYHVLNYISGVLYFLSTTVNPLLYNIMSNKFRDAFKSTLAQLCNKNHTTPHGRTYSTLSRHQTSIRHHPHLVHDGTNPALLGGQRNTTTLIQLQNSSHPMRQPLSNGRISRKFRPRCNSNSSQTTVLTSLSRSVNSDFTRTSFKNIHVRRKRHRGSFSALAQRLRILGLFKPEEISAEKYFVRHKSVDSGNTISDSSLQDLDEMEFSSSDLVKYMEEVNQDLS